MDRDNMIEFDHSRPESGRPVVHKDEPAELAPEQRAKDALVRAERALDSGDHYLVEVRLAQDPRLWEAHREKASEQIEESQKALDDAKEHGADADARTALVNRLTELTRSVAQVERPPIPKLSREPQIDDALAARPAGSLRDGHDRKEDRLHELFARLGADESRSLLWRIDAKLPEDGLVAAFLALGDARQKRLYATLTNAPRREAVALEPARRGQAAAQGRPAELARKPEVAHHPGAAPVHRAAVEAPAQSEPLDVELRRILEAGQSDGWMESQLALCFAALDARTRGELAKRFERHRSGSGDDVAARFVRLESPVRHWLLAALTSLAAPSRSDPSAAVATPPAEPTGSAALPSGEPGRVHAAQPGSSASRTAAAGVAPAAVHSSAGTAARIDRNGAHGTAKASERSHDEAAAHHDAVPSQRVDEPVPAEARPGFVDNSEGANIRTRPAELSGSETVTNTPLLPATRVFVTGHHPQTAEWWYVTVFPPGAIVRGYVQGFRITTKLPEPTAKLRQIEQGDTVERLAVQEFSSSLRDGHDLRYYENVLLFINRQQGRGGMVGTYQDPGPLGSGANNVQLIAGHRIWLVSPAYASALEGIVPSGSLTGGAVAKAKHFVQHIEDLVKSVTESPSHLREVAGEYGQAIHDEMPKIIGVMAGFIMAEAASAFLAASPTGVGQIAAVAIQLSLAAFGAEGMVQGGILPRRPRDFVSL